MELPHDVIGREGAKSIAIRQMIGAIIPVERRRPDGKLVGAAAKPGVSVHTIGDRDKWICHICGKSVNPKDHGAFAPTRDHLIPRSKGGSNIARNLKLAHRSCNEMRGTDPLN